MKTYALDLWDRATEAFRAAEALLSLSADGAASRAYYAAFYAVSALFATEECSFAKHSAVRAAVHRDLVHTKRWADELGQAYDLLFELRDTADYGGSSHAAPEDAQKAVAKAAQILSAVQQTQRTLFRSGIDTEDEQNPR